MTDYTKNFVAINSIKTMIESYLENLRSGNYNKDEKSMVKDFVFYLDGLLWVLDDGKSNNICKDGK